jgi:5-methylcytosine-specific restriction protein B
MSYHQQLKMFLEQAKTDNLRYSHYDNKYRGLNVSVSFGQGNKAKIPWIAFLKEPNTVMYGIYPVYLYYRDYDLLILSYGVSETNEPIQKWKVGDTIAIGEYFKKEYSEIPKRYKNSFIYKVYNINDLPSDETLDTDLHNIIEQYLEQEDLIDLEQQATITNTESDSSPSTIKQQNFNINQFAIDLDNSGLIYKKELLSRFVASLLTKPFLILTGLSGSGKTKLAQSFAQWICENEDQYKIIPVGADWTNREPLLGFPNALEPGKYVKPDSGALDLIVKAKESPEIPFFLILDEMNLSIVERYFADFLSVMESKEFIPLYPPNSIDNGVPAQLYLPSNLFIIGTVNIDETTNMFSPKVLDRSNTIEFRVDENEMESFLKNIKDVDMQNLLSKGASMANSFLEMSNKKTFELDDIEDINSALVKFFGELKKIGAEFGYRTASEILRLINQLNEVDDGLTLNEKIDIAIIQKLLPKLHGSRRKLASPLETLGGFCISDHTKIVKDVFENMSFDYKSSNVIYPLSLEKISRMYRSAIDNGFASFAEA